MSYTIVTDKCEGASDCVDVCPIACIRPGSGKNAKGIEDWNWIDFSNCIDCGICMQVCPVGAILPEERPDLQITLLNTSLRI